jgi:hypothetical protein
MPQRMLEGRNEEAVVLTRAVENLLRRLVSFLVGRISLVKLQEIVRYIFVEEIENKLKKENPTKNIPLSQLALLSGLDTRTLTKIRNSNIYRKPFYKEASFLKECAPGASILDEWSNKPEYVDPSTGEPKELDISGKAPSFESLYLDSTQSRGITFRSLLNRLVQSGAVSLNSTGSKVVLVALSYLPTDSKDKLGAIEMGFSALGNLTDTVTNNIHALENSGERLFQRGAWTYRLHPRNTKNLQNDLNKLLEETDLEARQIIENYEESGPLSEPLTAGVSYFYFEEQTNQEF